MKFFAHWCKESQNVMKEHYREFEEDLIRKHIFTGEDPEKCNCCGKDYQEFNLDI